MHRIADRTVIATSGGDDSLSLIDNP